LDYIIISECYFLIIVVASGYAVWEPDHTTVLCRAIVFYKKKVMTDKTILTRLKTQFNRLSKERQAEVLGMAKAFAYVQQSAGFDIQTFIEEILQESRNSGGKRE
jgi:hypothetical protein